MNWNMESLPNLWQKINRTSSVHITGMPKQIAYSRLETNLFVLRINRLLYKKFLL